LRLHYCYNLLQKNCFPRNCIFILKFNFDKRKRFELLSPRKDSTSNLIYGPSRGSKTPRISIRHLSATIRQIFQTSHLANAGGTYAHKVSLCDAFVDANTYDCLSDLSRYRCRARRHFSDFSLRLMPLSSSHTHTRYYLTEYCA